MKSNFLLACAGVFLLLCTAISFGQYGCDPTDRTFVAYKLTPDEEKQFNVADVASSPFWSKMIDCGNIDHIILTPSNNGLVGVKFPGEDDAQLTTYIAYGDSGMYFYFKVQDNNWVDYQLGCTAGGGFTWCTGDWANDAIDFGIDPFAPDQHTLSSFQLCATCTGGNGWTKTCAQYQLRFGGAEAPTQMQFNFFDNAWDGLDVYKAIKWQGFTFAVAASTYGILNKIIPTSQSNVRVQEWRIPWRSLGNPEQTPVGQIPAIGGKISGYFGYNDVDADATSQSGVKELRTGTGDLMNAVTLPSGIKDSWSTVLFGPAMDTQSASGNCSTIGVRQPDYMMHVAGAKIVSSEYFSVNGQHLAVRNGKPIVPAHTLVIERKIDVNGVVYPHMIVVK
jgi:hypothetical protein